jgi:hypothetical protein
MDPTIQQGPEKTGCVKDFVFSTFYMYAAFALSVEGYA